MNKGVVVVVVTIQQNLLMGCTCVVSSTGFALQNYMRNGITFTWHGPVLECKHSAPVDVYLCLAYVSPFENNLIDSHGNV